MLKQAKTGLARALSKMGYCSRARAAELIRSGKVSLNGRVVRDPETPVRQERAHIEIQGSQVAASPKIYLMMNKPRGLVTTASDERGRATVYDLLKKSDSAAAGWVSPVGRLDKASEGLLLFTNDSMWADNITSPAGHLEKRYHVQINRVADDALLAKIRRGVKADGILLQVRAVSMLRAGGKNSWIEISLDEGKNRQIRRLLKVLDVNVMRLVRVSIGPLEMGELKKGAVRPLTEEEKLQLGTSLVTSPVASR